MLFIDRKTKRDFGMSIHTILHANIASVVFTNSSKWVEAANPSMVNAHVAMIQREIDRGQN